MDNKEVEQKYRILKNAYKEAKSTKNIGQYPAIEKLKSMSRYKELTDINMINFVNILFLKEFIRDNDQIFHAINIFNSFKINNIKIIKETIILFFR